MLLNIFKDCHKFYRISLQSFIVLTICTVLWACSKKENYDLSAPALEITSPLPGSDITGNPAVTLTGTVSSDTIKVLITYNDVTTEATLTGTDFSFDLVLSPGSNSIAARAQDITGNSITRTFILFYPELSFDNGSAASFVIGQADFIGNTANQGSTVAANTLSGVAGTLFKHYGTVLYVPDSGNHRILGYNTVPTKSNIGANFVVGQDNLTSQVSDITPRRFNSPAGVYATDTQFFVADTGSNRVLIWDSIPKSGSIDANHVIGQLDFTSSASGCSSSTLSAPASVFVVNNKVVVLDKDNNRVLIWNSIPVTDGLAADIVIGQSGASAMDTCLPNDSDGDGVTDAVSASTLNNPGGIWTDGTYLMVADTGNHRVLVWDSFPTVSGQAADWVLGQSDMVSAVPDSAIGGLNSPRSVVSNGNQVFVADTGNTRVLLWYALPTANKPDADEVIGPDFTFDTPAPGNGTLSTVNNIFIDRTHLYVIDDNRIVVFTDPTYVVE